MFGDHQVAAGRTGELGEARSQAQAALAALGRSFPRSRPWLQLQVRAKAAWWRQGEEVRFAADSPLEGTGFEPSVPLYTLTVSDLPLVGSVKGPSSQWTLSWREVDSNPRSPQKDNDVILTISLDGVRR